jgi:hypothetical protein
MNVLTNFGNWELFNETPFYLDAYQTELNAIWAGTQFNNEMNNLAYYRALTSMLRDNEVGEYQRRLLLRSYMKPEFAANQADDPINKLFSVMPSDNLYVRRALKNLCVVYTEKPQREIIGQNADMMTEVYNEIAIDSKLLAIHRIAKLTNEVAVTLIFNKYKPVFKYLTPDNYRLKYDSYGDPIEMWIPYTVVKNNSTVINYRVWTLEEYYVLDQDLNRIPFEYDGKQLMSYPNQIGELPYEFIHMDTDTDEYLEKSGGGLFELVKGQLTCNKLEFLTVENLTYNGFAVWLLRNWDLKTQRIKLSPGAILVAEGLNDQMGMIEPSAETIQPMAQFLDIEALKTIKMNKILKNLGLPSGLFADGNQAASSGVSMKLDRMELDEVRKEDVNIFRRIEDRLINKFAKILNTDTSSKYKGKFNGEYTTELDYIEQGVYQEPKDELEYNSSLFAQGLLSPAMYVSRMVANDYITDDEEAIKYIQTNLKYLEQIKGKPNDNTGGDTEPSTANDTGGKAEEGNSNTETGVADTEE